MPAVHHGIPANKELSPASRLTRSIFDKNATRIAIDGFGGAGKTTIAEELGSRLCDMAAIVHLDDFVDTTKFAVTSWDKGAFDRERLRRDVLKPSMSYQPLHYISRSGETVEHSNYSYLIVEGITACHPDIIDYFDLSVWVNVSLQKSIIRREERGITPDRRQFLNKWVFNDYLYSITYRPERYVDIVLDNEAATFTTPRAMLQNERYDPNYNN